MNQLNFGQALDAIKAGKRIARTGWNGKGMFVYLVPPASYPVQTGAAKAHFGEGAMVPYNAYMAIKNVDGTVSTWVPSVNDCLAADWGVVGDAASASDHPPHQQRVIDEKRELDDKLQKLTAFISSEKFSTIVKDEAERGRLVCQEETMKDYSAILAERIEAFGAAPIALPVIDPGPDSLEREIQAKADKAPRVKPADVKAEIVGETFTLLPSGRVTVCELTLKNGFTVRGESAVVFIENFNEEIGRKVARENAEKEVWQLLGFRLRDKISCD